MSEGLKRCPFCHGKAIVITDTAMFSGLFWTAGCETSKCRGNFHSGPMYYSEDEAIEAWNRRAIEPDAAKLIHDLYDCYFHEDADSCERYYKDRVEALGIDISDVDWWPEC